MSGIVSIAVGKRKTGKTTFSKEMLKKKPSKIPCIIYDINNEYREFYNEPFVDWNIFLDKIVELKGYYILIEEATIFFNPRGRFEEMINLLVRARHTKNIIQLNFHSFASIPNNVKDLIDYITIFKTNDNEDFVRRKVDKDYIVNEWLRICQSKNLHEHKTLAFE